jgi:hypothetical protein
MPDASAVRNVIEIDDKLCFSTLYVLRTLYSYLTHSEILVLTTGTIPIQPILALSVQRPGPECTALPSN